VAHINSQSSPRREHQKARQIDMQGGPPIYLKIDFIILDQEQLRLLLFGNIGAAGCRVRRGLIHYLKRLGHRSKVVVLGTPFHPGKVTVGGSLEQALGGILSF